MPENTLQSTLRENFPNSNRDRWKQTAAREVDGKDPFDILSWNGSDGIIFFPYYDHNDAARHQYLKKFSLTVGKVSFSGARRWVTAPRVSIKDARWDQQIALQHLSNGADGIYYLVQSSVNLSILLEKISWPHCSLFFQSSDAAFFKSDLPKYITNSYKDPSSLTGALFWTVDPDADDVAFYVASTPHLKWLGASVPESTPVQEIADALTQAVNWVEKIRSVENNLRDIFSAVAFSIPVDTRFFESIAKLKALRILWYQVTQAYGIKGYKPSDLCIHARSLPWVAENYEPHGNLIKSTTASMAAILGGCDALTVIPQDETNTTMSRIARNVASLLREESHFDKVADPTAGSYAGDAMIHAIADAAWKLFQNNMKR